MKIPRDLSGNELVKVLCRVWQYKQVQQVGSHIVLETEQPGHHRIVVPAHKVLRIGTLNGILRSIANHKSVKREEIIDTIR